jgi:hypothetical protein
MSIFPRLHDAILQTLILHWEDGIVRIRLTTGEGGTGVVVLEASGVLNTICPRAYPWGPSDFVNEAKLQQTGNGQLLTIEMQSGDLLEIYCKEVTIREGADSTTEDRL